MEVKLRPWTAAAQAAVERELGRNLSRHLKRVKAGESLVVTECRHEVAMIVPSGMSQARSTRLAIGFSATVLIARLDQVVAKLKDTGAPPGTTDAGSGC